MARCGTSARLIQTEKGIDILSSPLPGKASAPTGVAVLKASLRIIGVSDLADVIGDLTGVGRATVETLAARAVSYLDEHASEEFRELGAADREWVQGVVSRCYQRLASDPERRMVRESVVGSAQLSRLAIESMSDADTAAVEQANDDARAYLVALSETIASLVTRWYESDREANQVATTMVAGETLERVRRLPDEVGEGLQEYMEQTLLPQISAMLENQRGLADALELREPALLPVDAVRSSRLDSSSVLNDLGEKAGRVTETEAIEEAIDRSSDWPLVVLVSGRGGFGKSRLLVEILSVYQHDHPEISVRWLAPGRHLDTQALNELPDGAAIVVVDDAHRRADQLRPLLEYAKSRPDVQLILATRGPGISSIQAELVEADLQNRQVEEVPLGELDDREGRALVDSLLDGIEVRYEFRVFLATLSQRSPFLAVVTANLLRAGDLTGPLALDASLRKQVMVKYRDVVSNGIASDSHPEVRRMLATIAALSVVDLTDNDFVTHLQQISGLSRSNLLRATRDLREHDVLIGSTDATQFAVEMLGDQLLEEEAVIDGIDSGFVRTLWITFKRSHRSSVLTGIGSLAWRLGGIGPEIVRDIWTELRGEVAALDLDELLELVGLLRDVTYTQASEVVQLSKTVLGRLAHLDAEPRVAPADEEENPYSWFRESTPADVRRALAPILADAAVHDPSVLEESLDMLWALSLSDDRPLPQTPEHPSRLIADRLGNVGALPDPSFPERIARRVQSYLRDAEEGLAARSPLELLKPLLEKSGTTSGMADRRTVQFKPFYVNAVWARPVRDLARSILEQATTDGAPHIAEALQLLGEALMPPAGYFGAPVPEDAVSTWDDDDLATLSVLDRVADRTARPSVRRLVRQEAEWTAQYSTNPAVRLSALELITRLDSHAEDDVTEYLRFPGIDVGIPCRRGIDLPTLEEIAADIRTESDSGKMDDFDERYAAAAAAQVGARNAIALELWPDHNGAPGVSRLDAFARDLNSLGVNVAEAVHMLLQGIIASRPTTIPAVFHSVASLPPGPLDDALPQLLEAMRTLDEAALVDLVARYHTLDPRCRAALGRAAASYGWVRHGSPFDALIELGHADDDPNVRSIFLTTLRLDVDPKASAEFILASEAGTSTIDAVIRSTSYQASPEWSARLNDDELQAILNVIDRAGRSYAASAMLATLATDHPTSILKHLEAQSASDARAPRQRDDRVAEALTRSPGEVASWILEVAETPDPYRVIRRLQPPLPAVLTPEMSDALVTSIASADAETTVGVASALTGLNGWVPFAPALARSLLERSVLNTEQRASILRSLQAQLTPGFWSGSGGRSAQLDSALDAVTAAASSEPNRELKELLELAATELTARIAKYQLDDELED